MAGVAWRVPASVFKTDGARREALSGGFDSHRLPPSLHMGRSMSGCAFRSQQAGEPMAGSALECMERWILLEHRQAWPARPKLQSLGLPAAAEAAIQAGLAVPRTRLQLLRRPKATGPLQAFLVEPLERRVRRVFSPIGGSGWSSPCWKTGKGMEEHAKPLLLVCTHGSRDRCCGREGGALFQRLFREAPDMVWQSSHLGGHRFAPTALSLPDGLQYGRIRNADGLVEAVSSQRLFQGGCLRGKTCWPKPAQAAAAWISPEDPTLPVLLDCLPEGGSWLVSLSTSGEGERSVRVRRAPLGVKSLASCADTEPRELYRWVVSPLGSETR